MSRISSAFTVLVLLVDVWQNGFRWQIAYGVVSAGMYINGSLTLLLLSGALVIFAFLYRSEPSTAKFQLAATPKSTQETPTAEAKAQWQWEAAEQGKAANQLRQRWSYSDLKSPPLAASGAEAEASFLLAESRKQLATLEDGKRSLMEGLQPPDVEVHRFKAELQRWEAQPAQAPEVIFTKLERWSWWRLGRSDTELGWSKSNTWNKLESNPQDEEVESRSQPLGETSLYAEAEAFGWGTLRKLQLEYAELLAGTSQRLLAVDGRTDGPPVNGSLACGLRLPLDEAEDQGIQTAEDSRFFGLSAGFESFSNEGKELIIQYQAKYEKDIECGGGYVKVGPKLSDPKAFGDPTAYNIMFGPDKCGYTKRTHLIFNYKGKNVLKKSDLAYKQEGEGTSHVYRLVLKPDSTCRVEIDGEKIYEGSLKEDWELLAPKEIKDPDDKKPSDWVDDSMMDDPEDKKPADWVEEKRIVDSKAKKPDDWDDEEDGEWEAPMIDNPDYKGEWTVKRISNPAYKGIWEAKKIANPDFVDDDSLYKYQDFGFIGFDLWQVKGNTIFDNVIITDEVAEADKFLQKWKALSEVEKAKKKEEDDAKAEEAKKAADSKDED
ncbi:Calreticulin, partial [Durusdinium trenchii]